MSIRLATKETRVDINLLEPHSLRHDSVNYKLYLSLLQSIERNGLYVPIIIAQAINDNGKFNIVDGYHRFLACKALGYKEIQAIACKGDAPKLFVTVDLPPNIEALTMNMLGAREKWLKHGTNSRHSRQLSFQGG